MPQNTEQNGEHEGANYEPLVRAEQVKQLYGIAPIGSVATLINSLIVFFVTKEVMDYSLLVVWLVALWTVAGLRIALFIGFRVTPFDPEAAPLWKRRFLISLALIGLAWGSIALVPFEQISFAHEVFLAFVLGGMAAGASPTFSMTKHGYAAFSVPALAPLITHFLLVNDLFHNAMAAMLFLFGTLLWWGALHNYSVSRASLLLRFENQEIIESLKAAIDRAEGLNARLMAEIDAKLKAEAELRRHHRHLERVVEQRTAQLTMVNKELEEFAFIASHDLKAPLRAVANLALIIEEDAADRLDEATRDQLRLLRERVKAMDTLIEALLSYARLGRSGQEPSAVALGPLLRELIGELTLPPGFRVELEEPLPTLCADPMQLRQIFQNLISNAIAHHDRAEGQVWIRARDERDTWLLEVADDGPGIPEHARASIFRMFATSGKPGHTGIGLAVAHKLILTSGGQIEVVDNRPRGAVFRIRWRK